MRRTFQTIALLAALASAPACLAQQQPLQEQQQLQAQHDRQQWDAEQNQNWTNTALGDQYRAMAGEARHQAERAKAADAKAKWLKSAKDWDQLALQAEHLQADR